MKNVILLLSLLVVASSVFAEPRNLVHILRFNDYESGSEEDWLLSKGFQLKEGMSDRRRIDLEIGDESLIVEAKRKAFGLMSNETVNISEFSYMEIDWGVNMFPEGASYEQGVRNEALMVFVFMGDERLPSGSMFIPDSPFFVGLFLCDGDDRLNHPYKGAYFKKGGRYVCVGRPKVGDRITSRFNLIGAYRNYYDKDKDDDPGISGIAIALDTKKAKNKGRSSAFIHEIRFYK